MEDGPAHEKKRHSRTLNYILCFLILAGLYLISSFSYLLFHSLAEIFSIVVACAVFMVAWNARTLIDNSYLMFLGISFLFVGGIDTVHMLAYKGMGVFPGQGANPSTQLWIAARFLQAFSFLAAPYLFGRRIRFGWVCAGYAAATAVLLASIFVWKNFPTCYVEGVGLTSFKKTSEYIISGMFLVSGGLLLARKDRFEKDVLNLLLLSIALLIASELAFTFYVSVYGFSNLVGHFFKILSFLLVYRAIVETGFSKPYGLIFREMKKTEDALLRSKEELDFRVKERTAELNRANERLRKEAAERIRAFDALRDSLEKLRDAHQRLSFHVNRMPLAYIVWDKEFRVVEWNPAAERIFAWKSGEVLGKHPYGLIVPAEAQPHVERVWSKLLNGDETSYSVNANVRKDGRTITCEWFNTPLRDGSGNVIGVLSMVHDVTEKTHLERQLQTAQRMEAVGTLAGGIAHDFNNALTGIFGFAEMLKSQFAENEPAISNLNEILRCANRASTLTRQLLTYSRRQIIEPVNLNLNNVLTDLIKLISKVAGEHIEIRTFLAKNLPTIRADVGQLEQVVMNLVLNARDAMPGGGQLLIETGMVDLDAEYVRYHPYMKVGSYVVVTVSDTGIGMNQKTQERVFEPFFTTKGSDKGTGLGLSMVYGIVKQHNGFIHLYSEPGKGTTFKVYLPPVDAAPDAIELHELSEIRGGTETILLAEDDESVRLLVKRTLTELGYTVLAARNGEDAIEVFHQDPEKISLALLDVVMPVSGGKEAYEAMHRVKPDLKVIFMSGYTVNAVHESFVLIAGVPFLSKPFGPDTLARKVREVLNR